MSIARPSELVAEPEWYRDAVIYELHVRAYADLDGDGVGDFAGLATKLDYLHELGITAVWLLPFYPSPQRDGGYDISDFRRINPVYGDVRLFRRLVRAAHERGLRIITELVLNHTSDQHPWFQRARRAPPGSRWRNFYVWSDTPERYAGARIIFQDFETSNWTWDPVAGAYFWHRFYSHQPDLNFDNPEVQDELFKVVDHWMDIGVDGVRLDAVPYLFEREGTNCENLPETHAFIKKLRAHVDARHSDRLLLAEANQWPEDAAAYFGDGDECHMNFHFPLMPRLFMAVRQENRLPVIDILEQTPQLPKGCQWATFLRNHDELTLEMVTDEERDYMYRSYASDPAMRLNLGIRRRLAPLMGNDRRKIELLNGLLFTLPGTPVLYYGDEIGMGDNVYLGDRDGVRTPMQWSPDRNAGFSRAGPQRLYLPPVVDGPYHYETVNVENQRHDPHSLLSWMRQLIAVRRRQPVLSRGDIGFLDPDNHRVLAYVRILDGEHPFLVVANLSARAQAVELDLREWMGSTPLEVFGRTPFAPVGEWPYYLTLGPYAFYWFELVPRAGAADLDAEREPPRLDAGWPAVLEGRSPPLLEPLARWLAQRRWFAGKSREVAGIRLASVTSAPGVASTRHPLRICFVRVDYVDGDPDTYVVPLTVVDDERTRSILTFRPDALVAFTRDGRAVVDALVDDASVLALVRGMAARRARYGELDAEPFPELRALLQPGGTAPDVRIVAGEQSNSSVIVGDAVMVKVMRRLPGGVNPDLEINRHLRAVGYRRGAELLGWLARRSPRGEPDTIALAYRYVPNEGDAWDHALDLLDRLYEGVLSGESPSPPPAPPTLLPDEPVGTEPDRRLGLAGPELVLLGQRTAELHLALAEGDDDAFRPEPFSTLYQRSLYQGMRTQLRTTMTMLRRRAAAGVLDDVTAQQAERVLGRQDVLMARLSTLRAGRIDAMRIRTHGDFHLGQVLYTGRDFILIDFEGEPARPVSERRIKHTPLRDVAGMVRSFDYVAQVALEDRRQRGLLPEGLEPLAQAWARWCPLAAASAYVDGYLATQGIEALLPTEWGDIESLLEVLVLEKALYELRYELDNRPGWVRLPLGVLADIVAP